MDQTPATMDKHLDVIQCHRNGGVLLGASSLTGRYWFGSLWYCNNPEDILCLEKCTAGVQLEAGLGDAVWLDDSKVLVGLDTGGVAVWELTDEYRTFVHVQSAVEHDDMVSSVSVATDKNRAVSGSYDKCIKVWDMETMSSVTTYRGHYDMVQAVKYHPTEPALILSCSQDGRTCLWDMRDQKQVTVLDTSPLLHSPTYVTWNPSSQYNYTVSDESGQIVIKDTRATQDTCITFCPHKRSVTKLEYNPDRPTILASVSEDCSTVVTSLGADHANQIYCDKSHTDFAKGASWNKSDMLLTCGWDSKVLTHSVLYSQDDSDSNGLIMETNHVKVTSNNKPKGGVITSCDGTNGLENEQIEN